MTMSWKRAPRAKSRHHLTKISQSPPQLGARIIARMTLAALDWRPALRLVETILLTAGTPSMIAARTFMGASRAESLSRWLRQLEAVLRVLVAALAAQTPEFKTRPSRWPILPPGAAGSSVASSNSTHWRVAFRFPSVTHSRKRRARPARRIGAHVRSTAPLAERFEAALRVLDDPALYARRYARRHPITRAPRAAPPPFAREKLTYSVIPEPPPDEAMPPDSS